MDGLEGDFRPNESWGTQAVKPQPKRLREDRLRKFVADLFAARGMSSADAASVAEVLVWADLRGGETHGISRIPHYFGMIDKGALKPGATPVVTRDFGALVGIDAQGAAGPVAMKMALAEAKVRARAHGAGIAIVGRATHSGAIGCYAEAAASEGFAAIVLAAGPPLMAYHGARVPSLSTAPLAIAVPGEDNGTLMLDMASSLISNGRLKQAKRDGESLPAGWALDAEGRMATDADKAEVLLPMGGAKGSAFALLSECMTSLLAGAAILAPMLGPDGKRGHGQNATIILIDIARLREPDDYRSDVSVLSSIIRSLPRAEGADALRLPGERAASEARTRRSAGVPIPQKLWDEITALANKHDVCIPDLE